MERRSFIGSLFAIATCPLVPIPKRILYAPSIGRVISRTHLDHLKDSISSLGLMNHILVDRRTSVAIDGYLRLVAAKELLDEGKIIGVPLAIYDTERFQHINVASNDLRIIFR